MINREMLEETFGKENVNKVITTYRWNENDFDEKFKEEIYEYLIYYKNRYIYKLEQFKKQKENNLQSTDTMPLDSKIKIYNNLLLDVENNIALYLQNYISEEIQKDVLSDSLRYISIINKIKIMK
jgi:hypothetical protein